MLHLVGELGELEIPPGLTALIASRLKRAAALTQQVTGQQSSVQGPVLR